ncbi:MAG: hypothetical protein LBP36_02005 [Oscillospiraceae bacterium]|jgi:hypothetical protein|nr:hypothetical protein [Oscillospiraceae bacterium]
MAKNSKTMRFFLGSSSPRGFYSKFDSLYEPKDGWYCRILKGSPGCGKSNLIKKVAEAGVKNKTETQYIYCSSDPDSLDGVVLPELKTCVIDGTAPHSMDPIYPGAVEHIINLGEFWNPKLLRSSREKIIGSNNANVELHSKAKKYLASYGAINSDTTETEINKIDFGKIKSYAKKLSKKIFTETPAKESKEYLRFISAISPQGIIFYEDNLKRFENIYEIVDQHGIAGDLLLRIVRSDALNHGFDVITCFNPLSLNERLESLLFPELNTAVVISNLWHSISEKIETKKIYAKRFLYDGQESYYSDFNKKTESSLIAEAISVMKEAKEIHDELESFYIKAMDFEAIDKVTEKIISEIF